MGGSKILAGVVLAAVITAGLAACQRPGPAAAPGPSAAPVATGRLDRARLLAADSETGNWPTTGRDFGKSHYSPLTLINEQNAGRLGLAWQLETGTSRGMEATPIVIDGVMYVSGVAGRVYALDAATGKELWRFEPVVDNKVNRGACCDMVNRGVAVWQGKVYVAALDGILYALNAADGKVVWQAQTIDDKRRGYSSTGAPEVAGKVVVIGNGGAESDARGYLTAYDLETGTQVWRFYVVPGDPKKPFENPELEAAAKTWDPGWRQEMGGGGGPWDALAYDPELNLLYIGTGNAEPWNRAVRSPKGGDNLYLSSVLALNADTGRMKWYYQEVPGEQWDYDATQPFILNTLSIGGKPRKVLMHAPKNGFFYIFDRATGELLSAEKYAAVTWATHIDPESGRPEEDKTHADYGDGKPKLLFPAPIGAHNWNPMSYSPKTGLVYIPTIHAGALFMNPGPPEKVKYLPGRTNTNVMVAFSFALANPDTLPAPFKPLADPAFLKTQPDVAPSAALKAWDPANHKFVWSVPNSSFMDHGGVLSTGGGLVVQGGLDGFLRVFRDTDGKLLKQIEVGTAIIAAPATYRVNGVQYIAVLAGSGGGGWSTWVPQNIAYHKGNANRILAFRLDGGPVPVPADQPPPGPIPAPPPQTGTAEDIAAGAATFKANCAGCHTNTSPAPIPDLRRTSAATHAVFKDIVLKGALQPAGMPRFDDVLSEHDADQLQSYILSLAHTAYDAQQKGTAPTPAAPAAKAGHL